MEEFRWAYAKLCAAPQEAVLRRLRERGEAPGRARLDLAEQSLSLETCGALGRLLPGAAHFAEVALGDCGLSEDGVKLLLHGLCSNSTVKSLDLKEAVAVDRWSVAAWSLGGFPFVFSVNECGCSSLTRASHWLVFVCPDRLKSALQPGCTRWW